MGPLLEGVQDGVQVRTMLPPDTAECFWNPRNTWGELYSYVFAIFIVISLEPWLNL